MGLPPFLESAVNHSVTVEQLLDDVRQYLGLLGIQQGSYRIAPPLSDARSASSISLRFGYPPELVEYLARHVTTDPFMPRLIRDGVITTRDTLVDNKMTEREIGPHGREKIELLRKSNPNDALLIPLFGPGGREGVAFLGFAKNYMINNGIMVNEMGRMFQELHVRVARKIEAQVQTIAPLSDREKTVLYWIAKGKSATSIAAILDVSVASIDTYTRRIFTKLQVNDRISATIIALSNGIIRVDCDPA